MSEEKNCSWHNGDDLLKDYHDNEWCKVIHDDQLQFELLCLEGASVGLSWKTVLYKRQHYRQAFHNFNIEACAKMSDDELEQLLLNSHLIRHRNKIFSVRKNAQAIQKIQKEFGSFDAYLWHFTNGQHIDNKWNSPEEIPTMSVLSEKMSKDMKKRGIGFVGPTITYSFLQAVGIVNDHLINCDKR